MKTHTFTDYEFKTKNYGLKMQMELLSGMVSGMYGRIRKGDTTVYDDEKLLNDIKEALLMVSFVREELYENPEETESYNLEWCKIYKEMKEKINDNK